MLDNSALVRPFVPVNDNGDWFIYTEMLDRGQRKGNNHFRLLKRFFHRSQAEFDEQMPVIKRLCDMSQVRACTRLSTRSFRAVGKHHCEVIVRAALAENWNMKEMYGHSCGTVKPTTPVWLFDVDVMDETEIEFLTRWLKTHSPEGKTDVYNVGLYLGTIPSKKGLHILSKPFNKMLLRVQEDGSSMFPDISLHTDNPTNLYIPDGAD